MKKILLAVLLIWTWSVAARAATVTLLSDDVTLEAWAQTNPPDWDYYSGTVYSGVPSYKSVRAYGAAGGSCYSGVGFLNTPSGDVSWAQANTDGGGFLPLPLPFTATADIDWEFSVDEQLQIDISFWTMPGTGGSGSITITDNTTGLAVYNANLVATHTPSINSLVLLPGTTYDLEVFMSAGCNNPVNPADLEIAWNASFVPEPMTLMLLGWGAFVLRSKHNNQKKEMDYV